MNQNRRSNALSTTVLYQFLGVSGGGALGGLLIALRESFFVGLILVLACLPVVLLSWRELSRRGAWDDDHQEP
jgi:predicted MFS family arabinose efflux permease